MAESGKLMDMLQLASPIFGLLINVISQILGFRAIQGLGLLKSIVGGFLVGFIGVLSLQVYIVFASPGAGWGEQGSLLLTNLIIYGALGYCYFHFANLGETARRIRLVRELDDSEGGLSMEHILERYNSRMIVDVRLGRLINNGQIYVKNERYFVRPSIMLTISRLIILMKQLILGKKSEFD